MCSECFRQRGVPAILLDVGGVMLAQFCGPGDATAVRLRIVLLRRNKHHLLLPLAFVYLWCQASRLQLTISYLRWLITCLHYVSRST